jgi:hypothetical protein
MTSTPPTISELAALYHDMILVPDAHTPRNKELRDELIEELKQRTSTTTNRRAGR